MNIRRTLLHAVEQQLVYELDNRRVVHIHTGVVGFRLVAPDFQILQPVQVVFVAHAHGGIGRVQGFVDGGDELVVLHQNGLGLGSGGKFDLVQRLQVGWIGYGDEQPVAAFVDRQRVVLAHELLRHQLGDVGIDLDAVDVEHRHAELVGGYLGNGSRRHQAVADHVGDEGRLGSRRLFPGLGGCLLGEQAIHNQLACETRNLDLCRGNRHACFNALWGRLRRVNSSLPAAFWPPAGWRKAPSRQANSPSAQGFVTYLAQSAGPSSQLPFERRGCPARATFAALGPGPASLRWQPDIAGSQARRRRS